MAVVFAPAEDHEGVVRLVRTGGVLLLTGSRLSIPGGLLLEPQC